MVLCGDMNLERGLSHKYTSLNASRNLVNGDGTHFTSFRIVCLRTNA